ncbi:MAG: helix-turn-helix domain-containing protein [Candidatus Omnitrophica bacterium]|nr:helix-turn-helix domain-containing protein [Candidatus Omnitrophota bacterium]
MSEKLLTTVEVARQLNVPESEVERLAREGQLKGLWIGGELLRFHPDDVGRWQSQSREAPSPSCSKRPRFSVLERLRDLLYTYDFYVLAVLLVAAMVGLIIAFR